jgi:hypothetical protein
MTFEEWWIKNRWQDWFATKAEASIIWEEAQRYYQKKEEKQVAALLRPKTEYDEGY